MLILRVVSYAKAVPFGSSMQALCKHWLNCPLLELHVARLSTVLSTLDPTQIERPVCV